MPGAMSGDPEEVPIAVPGTKANARKKQSNSDDRNRARLVKEGKFLASQQPRIIFHDDNTAMISVCKNGRNPTMRWLGRVHGISIQFLHQEVQKPYILLGHICSEDMAGDIHTKAFTSAEAEYWDRARRNINLLAPNEKYIIGQPGPGYVNLAVNPQRYTTPDISKDPWANAESQAEVGAMSVAAGPCKFEVQHHPLLTFERSDGQ